MSPAPDADAARLDGEARFKASLARKATEKAAEPFDIISQGRLESLPSGMQAQVKWLLRRSAAGPGQANPENYAPASRQMALQSLVNAVEARAEKQLATETLEELALPETVAAIEALTGARWSKIRASMILADIRKLVRLKTQHMPALVNERQKALAAADRRDIDHRVFPVSDYLRGAKALRAIASVLAADNRVHGTIFARDAAMLAVQAKAHLRLGELHMLNVGNLRTRVLTDGSRILTIAATMRKVHGTRSVPIRDPDVITMLDPLRRGPSDTPLWRNADGTRMTYGGVAEALARTGNLAVGERAGSNIMRRAAMLDPNSAERRRILLGQGAGSLTAETVYRRNESVEGKAAMERDRLEMESRVAERRSNIPARRMKPQQTLRT